MSDNTPVEQQQAAASTTYHQDVITADVFRDREPEGWEMFQFRETEQEQVR